MDPNGNKISTKTKVLVEDSYYRNYGDRIQLTVEWKAINTGKTPSRFGWSNKVLIDNEERIFEPYEGESSRSIQPLDETSTLTIRYNLPNAVNVDDLYWGLYHRNQEENINYRIKLNPEVTTN